MIVAALRRFAGLLLLTTLLTAALSLLIGLATGASASRSVSLGFYLVGSFLLISGFFVGNRGPVRLKDDVGVPLFGARFVRWATPAEREETINLSAVFVTIGFVLIVLGVLADTRYRLY